MLDLVYVEDTLFGVAVKQIQHVAKQVISNFNLKAQFLYRC